MTRATDGELASSAARCHSNTESRSSRRSGTSPNQRAHRQEARQPHPRWHQYTADALVTLATQPIDVAAARVAATTLIVHLSDDGTPPLLEGAGPISPETAERLCCDARKIASNSAAQTSCLTATRCASYPQKRALYKRSGGHCQYPGCTAIRELEGASIILAYERGGKTETRQPHPALPPPPQAAPRPPHPHQRPQRNPAFTDANGRAITANQPHAPPR